MVGIELPVLAMEHQYLITGDMPEFAGKKEQLHCIDFEGEIYMRQERGGMLMGTYERAGVPWSPLTTPWDFGQDLLPNDLERIAPSLEVGFAALSGAGRAPASGRWSTGRSPSRPTAIRWSGPVRGLKNFWVACGVMAGFSQGGGVGLALSHWMVDGDPGADIWGMDVARYGDWTTLAYTNAKVRENYSRRFRIRFPNEELPAARPLRTTPIYERLQAEHAVFGDYCGLEHPLWFAPTARRGRRTGRASAAPMRIRTSRRSARPCATPSGCWRSPTTASSRFAGRAPPSGCRASWRTACPAVGRIALTPMLNERGKLIGDFTLCRVAAEHFFLIGTYAAEALLPALVRAAHARRRRVGAALRDGVRRPVGRRTALARAAAEAGARRSVDRGVSVHDVPAHGSRHGAGATSAACPSPANWATRSG